MPAIDAFYSLLSTTRSIRRIKDTPIEKNVLERICQAAIWAPSGGNRQPWRLIVVQDQKLKAQLSALYVAEWDLSTLISI